MSVASDLKVLFIVGKGRSGSTLLGDLAGSFPGVFHLGEAWRLWSHGLLGPHLCSCGVGAGECPVWSEILRRMRRGESGWAVERPEEVVRLQSDLFGFGGMARARLAGRYSSTLRKYRGLAGDLYRAAAEVTGSEVLVDGSKWPLDPALIDPPAGVEVFAVHLVRNPQAVATSWRRPKMFPDAETLMPRFGGIHTSLSWTARTWAAERVVARLGASGMTLRFEDFLADPAARIDDIATMLDAEWSLEVGEGGRVAISAGHTIMGNPSRFVTGEVELVPPSSPVAAQPLVAILTWPWRRRFGY